MMDVYTAIAFGAVVALAAMWAWCSWAHGNAWCLIIGMGGVIVILAGSSIVWPVWVTVLLVWLVVSAMFASPIGWWLKRLSTEEEQK